ncbi:hypothetical protein Hanom_Chr11g00974241 [Helianthus anomalus]
MELTGWMKMARFQTFWIQMQNNKPLDETRENWANLRDEKMAFYSKKTSDNVRNEVGTYNILIRWASMKPNDAGFSTISVPLDCINRSFCFVNKIRVEYIEFVTLHNLRGWIVVIVMSLVVFVPLVSSVHTVEIFWFSRSIFVMPPVYL